MRTAGQTTEVVTMKQFNFAYKALRWARANAQGPCSVQVSGERAQFDPAKDVVLDFFPVKVYEPNPLPSPRRFNSARYSGD
jgi:hypothetical protein